MRIYTEDPESARRLLGEGACGALVPRVDREPGVDPLLAAFFGPRPSYATLPRAQLRASIGQSTWRHVLVSGFAQGSQYERLIGLARAGPLPDGVACVARMGTGFKGFRGRGWVARPGNIQLAVHLAPEREIERFETVFMALAALSALDAIDAAPGLRGRAQIKWVNDILLHDAKVGGVLAYTQTRGRLVTSVVLGIGLNVESIPRVEPTAFVPTIGSLRSFTPDPAAVRVEALLASLLRALARNIELLLDRGYAPLMDRYRARSAVLGREVRISSDDADEIPRIFAAGRVTAIGDGLELKLAGHARPVTRGRLILPGAAGAGRSPEGAAPPGAAYPIAC